MAQQNWVNKLETVAIIQNLKKKKTTAQQNGIVYWMYSDIYKRKKKVQTKKKKKKKKKKVANQNGTVDEHGKNTVEKRAQIND